MKNSRVLMALAGLSLILSIACGQKKDDKAAPVAAVGVTGGVAVDVPAGPPRMPLIAYTVQVVAVAGATTAQAFASADGSQVGVVSGVTVQGEIVVDKTNGTVIPGAEADRASSVYITVTDDLVGQTEEDGTEIGPIRRFFKARSGRAANGTASMVFEDAYGKITVNGTYNPVNGTSVQSTFQGTIGYQNTNGSTGTLGTFSLNTCSFFRCQ